MKNIERAKNYQKKLYKALGREWSEKDFTKYWEGGVFGNEWDLLYEKGLLENNFCAWCGNDELKSNYYRQPNFSSRQVKIPICDDCFIEETGGNIPYHKMAKPTRSNCFIATAILKNPMHPDIIFLKKYRDEYLVKYSMGRIFIRSYYFLSPPIAIIISKHRLISSFVRKIILNPIVKIVRKKYNADMYDK